MLCSLPGPVVLYTQKNVNHQPSNSDSITVKRNVIISLYQRGPVLPVVQQTPEEKDVEERDQDRASRTARVQPTPQRKDPMADSPNNTNPDRRK